MTFTLSQFLPLLIVFFFASFAQGLTGFGFGVVSMGLLPLFLPIKAATPLVSLLNTFICIQLFWTLRRSVLWRSSMPLLIGMLIGLPLGVNVLVSFPEVWLKRLLGVYLIAMAVHSSLVPSKTDLIKKAAIFPFFPIASGIACGGLGGAFNIGGPPAVAFVYRQPWTQVQMNATLQAVFLISCALRASAYAYEGLYGPGVLAVLLPSLPLLFLGAAMGNHCVRRVDPLRLRKTIYVVLGFIGVKFLLG